MWWIALFLPRWPLDALTTPGLAGQAPTPSPPETGRPVVVEEAGGVVALNPAAQKLGLAVGQGVASARARAPGLQVLSRDRQAERRALECLAQTMMRYTPQVVLLPDGLLLELQSCLRLFGGPLPLWKRIQSELRPWQSITHWAAAPTPEAAALLARIRTPATGLKKRSSPVPAESVQPPLSVLKSGSPQAVHAALDALPIRPVLQTWGCEPLLIDRIEALGLNRLGLWFRLPRAQAMRRLGPGVVHKMLQAYGEAPDPRCFWVSPEGFVRCCELPERSHDLKVLESVLHQLLQELQRWLTARQRWAQVLDLDLIHGNHRHDPIPDTVLTLRLFNPERDGSVLIRLWRDRLARLVIPAPVWALRLTLNVHQADTGQSQESISTPPPGAGTAADSPQAAQALARLTDHLLSRLGPQAVLALARKPDHRPERASALIPIQDRVFTVPPSGVHSWGLHPCWLLAQPLALREVNGQPVHEGQILSLRTRAERIEAGWFDDCGVCRDYHVAEGADHRLRWVFRERQGAQWAWYLHGWFA